MRRVKPHPPVWKQLAPPVAVGLAGAALASVMTLAAVKFAPRPPQLAPLLAEAHRAFIDATAVAGLRLEALTVEGRAQTSAEDVLAALEVSRGAPILTIDPAEARAALEALPWVKAAQVERRLPNTVHVIIQEREPYALWQNGTRYTLVDRSGHPIVAVPEADPTMKLIVGADAPQHAADLFEDLDTQPDLAGRVRAAVRVSQRRWNIYLDTFEGGIAVRLPEDNVRAAWARLASLEHDYKILSRDLEFIDLRLPDRLIVRLHTDPNAPQEKQPKKPAPTAEIPRTGPGRTT
jgi:cell division protein FtsQ